MQRGEPPLEVSLAAFKVLIHTPVGVDLQSCSFSLHCEVAAGSRIRAYSLQARAMAPSAAADSSASTAA